MMYRESLLEKSPRGKDNEVNEKLVIEQYFISRSK